ncbi:hypothetical protein Pmani_024368 [Petrolisthes manimaculis]|uniref:Uncharacterized protein n=1 Tax=Petrolisthes manimaculis TaxID=1843537 RepID=A0AAE1P9E1_9EUCA|nr:hypothetical protein Pmani_024368 [Petrolisthes manimaculis]
MVDGGRDGERSRICRSTQEEVFQLQRQEKLELVTGQRDAGQATLAPLLILYLSQEERSCSVLERVEVHLSSANKRLNSSKGISLCVDSALMKHDAITKRKTSWWRHIGCEGGRKPEYCSQEGR